MENETTGKEKSNEDHNDAKNKSVAEKQMVDRADDSGYTPEENQFADGKGTQLDEEIDEEND